jgi:hypothetical protein
MRFKALRRFSFYNSYSVELLTTKPLIQSKGAIVETLADFTIKTSANTAYLGFFQSGVIFCFVMSLGLFFILIGGLGDVLSSGSIKSQVKSFLITNNISRYEILGFIGLFACMLIFTIFGACVSDDLFEGFGVIIFVFVFVGLSFFVYGLSLPQTFYGLAPTANGNPLKRLTIMDIINFGLCVIRVAMC